MLMLRKIMLKYLDGIKNSNTFVVDKKYTSY